MNTTDTLGPVIESERLSMRSLSDADEALYCSLYSDANVMRFVGPPLSKDHALEAFRKSLELMRGPSFERRVVVLIDRKTNEPLGISSIRIVDSKRGRAEVGTLLKSGAHEQGFAQECSTALITQAFSRPQISELIAHSANDNKVIDGLLTDLGFSRGRKLAAQDGCPARLVWTLTRDAWSKRCARVKTK
jgi:[ribosomal protein S5]-alanine N-acetyltransferase